MSYIHEGRKVVKKILNFSFTIILVHSAVATSLIFQGIPERKYDQFPLYNQREATKKEKKKEIQRSNIVICIYQKEDNIVLNKSLQGDNTT